nr:hypothetical protein [Tanacetum cinerariifolium]
RVPPANPSTYLVFDHGSLGTKPGAPGRYRHRQSPSVNLPAVPFLSSLWRPERALFFTSRSGMGHVRVMNFTC